MSAVKTSLYRVRDDLEFRYIDATNSRRDRCWRVDKITAHLDGQEIGYLKTCYIPAENFERYFPGILNWLCESEGLPVLPYQHRTTAWRQIPVDALRGCVYYMAQAARIGSNSSCRMSEEAKTAPVTRVLEMITGLEKLLKEERGLSFRRFRSYHVDKPIVDFISVEERFRRQGIGTALYRAGYEWMRRRGLPFYASTCQSELAKLAWQSMSARFKVEKIRERATAGHKSIVRLRFAA